MNATPPTRRARAATGTARRPKTVLVVDDVTPICELVAWHLSAIGYRVLTASDPVTAQQVVRSERRGRIDLLLTDVQMPGMRGDELAAWLASERPQARVVFMSSDLGCLGDTEADGFLEKPFSLAQLTTAVRQALAPEGAPSPTT